MNTLVLEGCTATPLAGYLKALGVLRLLATESANTRGFWQGDQFVLRTELTRAQVESFFLERYCPTPILAPWNGGSGFFEKDNKVAITAIAASSASRFADYQRCLKVAEQILEGFDREASPKDDDKVVLLTRARAQLPDVGLEWFDAAVMLSGERAQYPPLLGTGGNDGRLDFTNNFMQRALDVIDPKTGNATALSANWLAMALFAQAAPGLIGKAIGQFSPGQAGAPNGSTGFEGGSAVNPWDFILMIEGALMFAAAAVRRHADDPFGVLSYPFTVRAVAAGAGALGEADASDARGELWMPLWGQAASAREVQALLSEGRVALGEKPAKDALDFVRAVHQLGSDRGIKQFQRYGLLKRLGKNYLATPLTRVAVSPTAQANWLDELDTRNWLSSFRSFGSSATAATRFKTLRKRLEDQLFSLAGKTPTVLQAQAVLMLLGEIQQALSLLSVETRKGIRPIPRLSQAWVRAADDDSPAFRIAKALAGLRGMAGQPLPLCAQLFPVSRRGSDQWVEADTQRDPRVCDGFTGKLSQTLPNLLSRRLWLADQFSLTDKPLSSPAGATLDDVFAFLQSDAMDARIAALLRGLVLCDIPTDEVHTAGEGVLPAAFALLKLNFTPETQLRKLDLLAQGQRLPIDPAVLAQLQAGNHDNRAVTAAWRRLRASGLAPCFEAGALPTLAGLAPQRAAAALLIPLRFGATAALSRSVLKQAETV